MRTITTNVYQFDELPDAAKEKARDWYREASIGDNWFTESVLEDFQHICATLGIELRLRDKLPCIYWSGFSSQGDGACFEGTYTHTPGAAEKLTAYAPRDAELQLIAEGLASMPGVSATVRHSGPYCHAYSTEIEVEGENGKPVSDSVDTDVKAYLRRLMKWLYRALEKEWEYQNSDEAVDETIRANEYEFTEKGARCLVIHKEEEN